MQDGGNGRIPAACERSHWLGPELCLASATGYIFQDDGYLVWVGIVQTGFQTQKEALCLLKLPNVDVFSCSTSS